MWSIYAKARMSHYFRYFQLFQKSLYIFLTNKKLSVLYVTLKKKSIKVQKSLEITSDVSKISKSAQSGIAFSLNEISKKVIVFA